MESFTRSIVVQFRDFYKNLTPVRKMSIALASVFVLISAFILMVMVSGSNYTPAFTDVPHDQTAILVSQLQQNNIPYRVTNNGRTIEVPKDLRYSTQMALISNMGSNNFGIVGFELFDKQDFGTTSYAQRVNFQRALQGELMRAINTLDAVQRSKVMLAIPARKTFLEEAGEAKASVVLELHPGQRVASEQVRGIQHLVSSGVEGMVPESVSVVDSNGRLLSRVEDEMSQGSSQIIELKSRLERDIQDRVEGILGRVVGSEKLMVRVNADLNHRRILTTEETVDPDRTALISVQSEEETLDGARTNPVGVPGARANLPGAEDAGMVGFNQNVKKELRTQNFAVPRTIRNIKEAAGAIERLSVAVVVDGQVTTNINDAGEAEDVYVPWSDEDLRRFEMLVQNAIGFDPSRGDTVTIENIQFIKEDFSDADRIISSLDRRRFMDMILRWFFLGSGLILFFFLVIRPFMRWVTDSFQDSVDDMLPRTIEELEQLHGVESNLPGMSAGLPVLEESLDPDKAESELLKERIMALMERDEEKAAGALSLWLSRKDNNL